MADIEKPTRGGAIKTAVYGLIWTIFVVALWLHIFGNPLDEFRLVGGAHTSPIYDVQCNDEFVEDDSGHGGLTSHCWYRFKVNDHEYIGREDNIDETDEVSYLPSNPNVHRIKASIASDYMDFTFSRMGLGLLLLVMLMAPGGRLFQMSFKEFKEYTRSMKEKEVTPNDKIN